MSGTGRKVNSSSDHNANAGDEASETTLARFLASFEKSNQAHTDYQTLRQRLLAAMGEAAQSIRKHQDAGVDSRNGLAAANDVLASMKETMEQLGKSMQAEHEAVTLLLSDQLVHQDSAINQLVAAPPANQQLLATRPKQPPLGDRLLAPQIAEALRRVIDKEVDRRLHEIAVIQKGKRG